MHRTRLVIAGLSCILKRSGIGGGEQGLGYPTDRFFVGWVGTVGMEDIGKVYSKVSRDFFIGFSQDHRGELGNL